MVIELRRRFLQWRFRRWVVRGIRPGRFSSYGEHTVVHPPLTVTRPASVDIGERTYVLAGANLALDEVAQDVRLHIGSGTYLGRDLTIVCGREVWIGDDVMGSDRLYIADVEHEPTDGRSRLGVPRPVRIEDGVFLGTGAMVLPGVTVGARSLVAAGAVVTTDVPPNAVVVGNPARVVRRYDADTGDWLAGSPG